MDWRLGSDLDLGSVVWSEEVVCLGLGLEFLFLLAFDDSLVFLSGDHSFNDSFALSGASVGSSACVGPVFSSRASVLRNVCLN